MPVSRSSSSFATRARFRLDLAPRRLHACAELGIGLVELGQEQGRRSGVSDAELARGHRLDGASLARLGALVLGPLAQRLPEAEPALAEEIVEHRLAILVRVGGLALELGQERVEPGLGLDRERFRAAVSNETLDLTAQCFGALEALRRCERHGAARDAGELLAPFARQCGRCGEHAVDDLHQLLSPMRRAARDDLEEDRAEQVHVRVLGDLRCRAAQHLRRHVRRGPGELGRLRRERQSAALVVVDGDGDAPVDDVHLSERTDHHVLGLEIAVNDAAAVRVAHRIAHLDQDREVEAQRIARAESLPELVRVVDHLGPRHPLDPLHDDDGVAIVDPDVVDRYDVRVLERSGDPRLAQQLDRRRAGPDVRLHRLHRDGASERDLRPEPHDPEAALADRLVQLDRTAALRRELLEELHRALARAVLAAIGTDREVRMLDDRPAHLPEGIHPLRGHRLEVVDRHVVTGGVAARRRVRAV